MYSLLRVIVNESVDSELKMMPKSGAPPFCWYLKICENVSLNLRPFKPLLGQRLELTTDRYWFFHWIICISCVINIIAEL